MLLVLLLLSLASFCTATESELKFVQILFRHGDRAVGHPFKGDPYSESIWPQGYDSLTPLGIAQQYAFGQFLRERYRDYLPNNYTERDVYVRSSDTNRCLRSASANVAAFFPPIGNQTWNYTEHSSPIGDMWQPVAVHTVPHSYDLLFMEAWCPAYREISKNSALEKLPQIREAEKRNAEVLEFIAKNLDIDKLSMLDAWSVADTIVCQRSHGYYLKWVNETFFRQKIYPLLVDDITALAAGSPELTRFLAGGLLAYMLSMFQQAANDTEPPVDIYGSRIHPAEYEEPHVEPTVLPAKKLMIYSAHDTNVLGMLAALNVIDQIRGSAPRYTSSVILEMYANESVAVFYKNLTTWDGPAAEVEEIRHRQPVLLPIPNCGATCPLKTIIKLTAHVRPDNIFKECKYPTRSDTTSAFVLVAAIVGWTLVIIAGVALLIRKLSRSRSRRGSGLHPYM